MLRAKKGKLLPLGITAFTALTEETGGKIEESVLSHTDCASSRGIDMLAL